MNTAATAKSWPFEEARALLTRMERLKEKKDTVLFETGYGPSGLPHIGTFGEVARTAMVRHAFETLTAGQYKTRLICFSDDMDGLRKVPDNLPNAAMIAQNLGKPLTAIPDPFGTHESFGHHMNARLRAFLDNFGFDYEFRSSTETYRSGAFDTALRNILANYDKVMDVMLPTLGEERAETYAPFLPVSPVSGKVLLAKVVKTDVAKGTITYLEEDGSEVETPVTGGHCKLQWKPDMGMRWAALGVDYEMYGKDHLASAKLYDAICRIAGGTPPQQMMFELFLDENGQKISKSKGNGITIDEWLKYAPEESLALYMFTNPRRAKKLYFDVIPQQVDDYLTYLEKYHQLTVGNSSDIGSRSPLAGEPDPSSDGVGGQTAKNTPPGFTSANPAHPQGVGTPASLLALNPAALDNPVWHIHGGTPPAPESSLRFSLLLNLVSACNAEDTSVLWGFLKRELPEATPENSPMLDQLCGYAVRYYHDFVKPHKKFRAPTEIERAALLELRSYLAALADGTPAEDIQTRIYEIGVAHYSKETLREWFKATYELLLGASQGPRMGSFIHLFGARGTIGLIDAALGQKDVAA
ncbi:MAG: lysine--tRNA ligase [Alphaproteobacteria bacterium]|nr:lysine--tRNA ligase [Alphaproteobacteria bacterium]